jgi:DNA-binding IclR family transcriptional regulator
MERSPVMTNQTQATGVVRKAFEILSYFRLRPEGMTLGELSQLTEINRSTAHRLLSQLHAVGFLERTGRGRYRIGQALFHLGLLAPQPLELRTASDPAMSRLAYETGETVNLAVLDQTEILILHVIESTHEFRMAARVGSRRPFYLTALGKAIAAFLTEENLEALLKNLPMPLQSPTPNSIRDLGRLKAELDLVKARGYAIDNEEAVVGVRALAAPIFKGTGEVKASISLGAPSDRIPDGRVSSLASSMVKAADSVTIQLGGDPNVSRLLAQDRKMELANK